MMTIHHNKGKVFSLINNKHIISETNDIDIVRFWVYKYDLHSKLKRNKWYREVVL